MASPAKAVSRMLVVVAALLLALTTAAPTVAAAPCWRQVLNDWIDDGHVASTFAPSCYDAALKNLPTDVEIYSDAADAITAARDRALRGERRVEGLDTPDSGPIAGGGGRGGGGGTDGDRDGPLGSLLNWGPGAVDDMPLPLLALGAVALLLLAAGAAGLVSRRLHGRRLVPAADAPVESDDTAR